MASEYLRILEVDPTGRYVRYDEILGKGASKIVYRGFDEYEGIEVAWNQVRLNDFLQCPEDLERLYCEIHLLKTLKHKNIMKFNSSWVDTSKRKINFITELFTSGTLRHYVPPIIHRDLKCDNIFVNGNQGEVKIGDLGLAAILRKSHVEHCVGTPEFMAPEVYEEAYNELVDIYSFGMCVLEMVTCEFPYSECPHPAHIYKKVIYGKKPDAFYELTDPEIRRFVEKCISKVSERPSARELLNDPFLQIDDHSLIGDPSMPSYSSLQNNGSLITSRLLDYGLPYNAMLGNGCGLNDIEFEAGRFNTLYSPRSEFCSDLEITIKGLKKDDRSIFLRLMVSDREGNVRNIYFHFDVENDTAFGVASEMVVELNINDRDVIRITGMIDKKVSSLVPEWKPSLDTRGSLVSSSSGSHEPDNSSTSSLMKYLSMTDDTDTEQLNCSHHGRFGEIAYHVAESEHGMSRDQALSSSNSNLDEKKRNIHQLKNDMPLQAMKSLMTNDTDTEQLSCALHGRFGEIAYYVAESEHGMSRDHALSSSNSNLDEKKQNIHQVKNGMPLQAMKSFHYGTNFSYQMPSDGIHGKTSKTSTRKKSSKKGTSVESKHIVEEKTSYSAIHDPRIFTISFPFQRLL